MAPASPDGPAALGPCPKRPVAARGRLACRGAGQPSPLSSATLLAAPTPRAASASGHTPARWETPGAAVDWEDSQARPADALTEPPLWAWSAAARDEAPRGRPFARGLLGASAWLLQYSVELGHPPGTAEQLCAFAANRGVRLPYSEAQRALRGSGDLAAPAPSAEAELSPATPVATSGGPPEGAPSAGEEEEGPRRPELPWREGLDRSVPPPRVPPHAAGEASLAAATPRGDPAVASVAAALGRASSEGAVCRQLWERVAVAAAPAAAAVNTAFCSGYARSARAPPSPLGSARPEAAGAASPGGAGGHHSRPSSGERCVVCNCGAVCTGAEVLVASSSGKACLCLRCAELSRQRSARSLERLAWPAVATTDRELPPQATVVATVVREGAAAVGSLDTLVVPPSPAPACTPDLRVSQRGRVAGGHEWAHFSGYTPSSPSEMLSPSTFSQRTSFGSARAEFVAQAAEAEHVEQVFCDALLRPPRRSRSCSFESFALPADMRYGLLTEAISVGWRRAPEAARLLGSRPLQQFVRACRAAEQRGVRCGLDVVFHWTRKANLPSIAEKGLLVADGIETPVVHGRRLGPGVYASHLFHYGRKYGDVAVLCLALPGPCFHHRSDYLGYVGEHCSLQRDDVVVYKAGSQLLPCAAVCESQLVMMCGLADETRDLVLNYFPGLRRAREAVMKTLSLEEAPLGRRPWDALPTPVHTALARA